MQTIQKQTLQKPQRKKRTLAMLLGMLPDPRMLKRVAAEKTIANVHVISWDRGSNMLKPPAPDGYTSHEILLPAKPDPLRRLIPYATFTRFAREKLRKIRPDIIHVQSLDMLKIACYHKHHEYPKLRIIYEVPDLHKLLVDEQKTPVRKAASHYLRNEDIRLSPDVDLLIVTSEKYYDTYYHSFIPPEKMLYMPNVPDLSVFTSYKKRKPDGRFVVGFIGSIRYKHQIRILLEAAEACGAQVMLAGFENEPNDIERSCMGNPNVEWIGKFSFDSQVADLYGKCDVIYSVYDADMANVRVALPNKLYESIYCKLPIIVAKNTYLSELVEGWGIGLSVDHRKPDDLILALQRLRGDASLYERCVQNCEKLKDIVDLQHTNEMLLASIKKIMES